jgi:thiol-disulfide isomerase/thioredoxin
MRVLLAVLLLLGGAAALAYYHNPAGCVQVAKDFTPTGDSSHLVRDLMAVVNSTTNGALKEIPGAQNEDVPTLAPARPKWSPPALTPVQPHWTWTTSTGQTYHEVTIVKIEPDAVTILHAHGGARVPIDTLPPELQKQLNYDPDAARVSATAFQAEEDRTKAEQAQAADAPAATPAATPTAVQASWDANLSYADAVAQSKASNKPLLLHFTGSDWAPYCKYLDNEVISTSSFQSFSAANFVFVTLDFPHSSNLPNDVKQQNQSLARQYNVTGFPTLLVVDLSGKEVGRTSGYDPGSGPDPVIAALRSYKQ